MQQAIVAAVVMLVLFAGAFAALLAQRSRVGRAGAPQTPWWRVAGFCSVALGLAVVVLAVYLQA